MTATNDRTDLRGRRLACDEIPEEPGAGFPRVSERLLPYVRVLAAIRAAVLAGRDAFYFEAEGKFSRPASLFYLDGCGPVRNDQQLVSNVSQVFQNQLNSIAGLDGYRPRFEGEVECFNG